MLELIVLLIRNLLAIPDLNDNSINENDETLKNLQLNFIEVCIK